MAVAGHLTRDMLEHYSHVRMAAKREAVMKLEGGLISPLAPQLDATESANSKVN
jgi:hypothetical protein